MKSHYLERLFRLSILAAISLLLIACGDDENTQAGDPNNGASAPTAAITAETADIILMSSLESIQAKASVNEASDFLANQATLLTQGNFTNLSPPLNFSFCDNSALPTPVLNSSGGSVALDNLCILTPDGVKIMLSGTVNFSSNGVDSATVNMDNFAIMTPNETFYLTLDIAVAMDNITFNMQLTNSQGVEISTANLEVHGGMYSGITDVSGSIMVANYGTVNVNMLDSDPLTFACTGNNVPSSGTIEVIGADDSSASITFNNCDSYTMTVNGVEGDPITWPATIPVM